MIYYKTKVVARKVVSILFFKNLTFFGDFPSGTVVKNLPAKAGDMGSIPVPGNPTCHGATKTVHHNY